MIRTELMSHQEKIVYFCKNKEYAGIFAEYGTGKTLCALSLIQVNKWKRVLVVSTKLAIESTWVNEVKKHSDFRFCILKGTSKQKLRTLAFGLAKLDDLNRYSEYSDSVRPILFLINYEGVKSIYYELQRAEFDVIFADESTKIKTISAERTKALIEVGKYVKNRYIMTGFPVTEHLAELYSQIKFLDHGKLFGNSYWAFLNRYFVRIGPKMIIKKNSKKQILEKIKPFCIRITNEMLKLPPSIYKDIDIEMTDQQRNLLTDFNKYFRLEFGKVKIDTQYIFTLISKSLQICDGFIQEEIKDDEGKVVSKNLEVIDTNKDETLVELLEEINPFKNKVVIWCAFLFSIRKLEKLLSKIYDKQGVKVLTLTGESEDVNKIVSRFQKTKDHNILIATQKKAAESVTLTEARYAIYYSNLWSFDLRANSEARIRRKGSEKHSSIMYIDLITKNSIERKVYDCLIKKKDLINELKNEFLVMKDI